MSSFMQTRSKLGCDQSTCAALYRLETHGDCARQKRINQEENQNLEIERANAYEKLHLTNVRNVISFLYIHL